MTALWRWLFKPEVLFFFGTSVSLLPLLLWRMHGAFPNYEYVISYIPAVIWITGYLAFWIGAKCASLFGNSSLRHLVVGNVQAYSALAVVIVIAVVLQTAGFISVYGGIPFVQYLSGRSVVDQTEQLTMRNAVPGQLGLFLESELVLDGLIVILIVSTAFRSPRGRRGLLIMSILTDVAAGIATGKRQTVAITAVMIACSSAIYFGDPIRPALQSVGVRRSKWLSRILLVVLPLAFVAFLGFMVRLRTGYNVTGGQQVLATLHIGMINLETQVAEVGYGPRRYDILRLTQYLLPDRLRRRIARFNKDVPLHAEPTASAGFYGDLHWNAGMPGVIIFAFLAGLVSKYFYRRARSSLFHLVAYSLMSWTLIAPHSYNHFLHLTFLWVPCFLYWVIIQMVSGAHGPGDNLYIRGLDYRNRRLYSERLRLLAKNRRQNRGAGT